jgi:hypothetical protein
VSDNVRNIQLFDYDNDGIEEIFIGYSNDNIMKLSCYDLSGNSIFTHLENLESYERFQRFTFIEDGDEDKLLTVSNFRRTVDYTKSRIRLYNSSGFNIIDSLKYQVSYPYYDVSDPLDIKTIIASWQDSIIIIYIGYIISTVEYYGGIKMWDESYITKIVYSDSFNYVEDIEDSGKELYLLNDSLVTSIGYYGYTDTIDEFYYKSRYYYLKTLTNEIISSVNGIFNIHGSYNSPNWFNNFPIQFKILTNNNLNSDIYGNVLYYKTYDSDTGTIIHFINYSENFSETLWESEDTDTGTDDIKSSSCIDIYNNEKYILYFRTDSLEIRDRVNGNIYYHQESSIIPSNILRLSDGELLLFVDRDDDNGYDVYTLDGPFFGIDQDDHAIDDQRAINFPNPFHSSTSFSFTSKDPIQNAEIKIYNIKGQLVRELHPFSPSPLHHFETTWDGNDKHGQKVSPGVYLYQLIIDGEHKDERKCLLIE